MLPTSPRLAARSMRSSCTTPEPVMATRVSCGVTLTRMSSLTLTRTVPVDVLLREPARRRARQPLEHLGGLEERQPHHPRVAAAQLGDEARGRALDRVGAGLVVGLAGGDLVRDLAGRELLEPHLRSRQRALEAHYTLY